MPDFIIENSISSSFIVIDISDENEDINYFVNKMICENRIPGSLSFNIRNIDDKKQYAYNITDKKSLKDRFDTNEINYNEGHLILLKIKDMLKIMNEYLIDTSYLLIDPEYVFVDSLFKNIEFIICPIVFQETEKALSSFMEFILTKINHDDEKLVNMAYQVYSKVLEGDYSFKDINLLFDNKREKEAAINDNRYNNILNNNNEKYNNRYNNEKNIYNNEACQNNEYWEKSNDRGKGYDKKKGGGRGYKLPLLISSIIFTTLLGITIFINAYGNRSFKRYVKNGSLLALIAISGAVTLLFLSAVIMEKYHNKKNHNKGNYDKKNQDIGYDDKKVFKSINCDNYKDAYFSAYNQNKTEEIRGNCILRSVHGRDSLDITKSPYIIGKDECRADGVIYSNAISRVHARIFIEDEEYLIEDMGSTNGTTLNGVSINANKAYLIYDGDVISFAGATYVLTLK